MEENKMIMDDVVETKVSDADIAKTVAGYSNGVSRQQFVRPRTTRTIIRNFNKKVMPNDLCPCGSGKKFKKCCMGNGQFEGTRELSAQEMSNVRFQGTNINNFKQSLNT